ncbi:Polygalacturonase inhibitor protein [Rhynchospora pubera]|uniref:Polygalacturonase inhibitor protein n=1 Tax=Rhynchospora pubera TaxID=906938 RepID=A0AAV8DL54_9POAL|nr:Polygalacturonase inhibitor protein [Rhynchospora pubera]
MSIIIFLVFLLCCTSSVLSTKDDEIALLKIKKQLGDPYGLGWWVKGFDYCNRSANVAPDYSDITCTSTGRVESLILKNLNVTKPFPDGICSLTEMDYLEIYKIPVLYGPIPSCFTKLYNLVSLYITYTSLSGAVPDFSGRIKPSNLTFINLSQNQFSGTIPSSFGSLPKLYYLDLSFNRLTGTIPPALLSTSSSSLELANNNLTGEIPKCYGAVNFSVFIVRGNRLNGDPSFLFRKQQTAGNIELAHNDFKFDLSNVEFSDNLWGFDISHNKIYGRVPNSFATAAHLRYPNLSFNRLCGELPQGGNMGQFDAAIFANNACLCGYPLQPCSNSAPAPAPAPAFRPPF